MAGIEKTKIFQPFELEAYCILPDHIHLLMSLPESIKNYSNIIREIKKTVTKNARKHLNLPDLVVWQDRFWEHTIRDERDMQTHYDYIHYNPVKHGYVESADQWKWSSMDNVFCGHGVTPGLEQIIALNQNGYLFGE